MRHTHEIHVREMHPCICKMHVYEVYAAVGVHLGGTSERCTFVRSSLSVNVYEIYGNFDFDNKFCGCRDFRRRRVPVSQIRLKCRS